MRQIRYLEQSLAHGFVRFESYGRFYYNGGGGGGGGDHCGAGASGPPGVSPLITQHFQSQEYLDTPNPGLFLVYSTAPG